MILEKSHIRNYASMLTSVATKEDGIRRLYRYVTWPNGKFDKNAKDLFAALCEFAVFNECVKQPFHLIVKHRIEKRMGELYAHIANLQDKSPASLTYKEAFMVFQILGKEQTQKILDVEDVSSYAYNNILKSLEEHDYSIFEKALGEGDYSSLMKNLWMVRFILLGIRKQPKYADDFKELLKKNQWQDGVDLSKFFNLLMDEDKFIEDQVNEFVQQCLTGDETIEVGLETHTYDIAGDYSLVIRYADKNRLFFKELNDIDKEKFIEKIHGVTSIADGTYYPAWLDKLNQKYQTGHDIDRLVRDYDSEGANNDIDLTVYTITGYLLFCQRNAISDYFKVDVSNFFVTDRETISWKGYEEDIAALGTYIIYYTALMLEVYGCVKDILYKEDRIIIEWLLGCSKYTERVKYLLNELYSKEKNSNEETTHIVGAEVSVTDTNPLYPTFLRSGGRLHNEFLQGVVCKKYLPQWFSKTSDPLYIKYVFFGSGIEPKEKLVFTGSKTELTIFVLFLTKGYGKSEIWAYFNQYIVDKNGKHVFAKNARSNVKENLLDAEDRMRQAIIGLTAGKKLSKEEEEDLK